MFKTCFTLAAFLFYCIQSQAQIDTQTLTYSSGEQPLQGYIAFPEKLDDTKSPAVMIVHDWMGLSDFTREKAKTLAGSGIIGFAVDVYGPDNLPTSTAEAGKLSSHYKTHRDILRDRMQSAYKALLSQPGVDSKRIVVMGYCFGGTAALELARSGADLVGTATFHGGLSTPTPKDAHNIQGKVLVMHGADDPHVPPEEVNAFKKEMNDANVDLTFVSYDNAVHAFTNPQAGDDPSKGSAYNEEAAQKSWKTFTAFLDEVFSK